MALVIGIDACRIRSGGGIAHLVGILKEGDPTAHGIGRVHVWSYGSLLGMLPDVPWLVKHNPPELERSLLHQLWWQFRCLSREARKCSCDVLFATDATTVCDFHPCVVMSQDMLSFEPVEMERYGLSKARVRLLLRRIIQTRSMRRSDGVIFLTDYAARVIQDVTGRLACRSVIPHGVDEAFRQARPVGGWAELRGDEIRCMYVSNAAMYKHQWVVAKAVGELRRRGHRVSLLLVGGGNGRARRCMDEAITETDPQGQFIQSEEFVPHRDIPGLLAKADLFIFASTCENLPVTLLEAMAAGLPIACSDRGPMPEVLADGGVYFDPEDADSIARAVEQIIDNPALRQSLARRAKNLSEQYSWSRCADETWAFIREIYQSTKA